MKTTLFNGLVWYIINAKKNVKKIQYYNVNMLCPTIASESIKYVFSLSYNGVPLLPQACPNIAPNLGEIVGHIFFSFVK